MKLGEIAKQAGVRVEVLPLAVARVARVAWRDEPPPRRFVVDRAGRVERVAVTRARTN